MHLIEPLAFTSDDTPGLTLPFQGGASRFALARLHAPGAPARTVPANAIPAEFADALARVTTAPSEAGLPPGPLLMGIVNVTPDSFSDGGLHFDPRNAISAGLRMIEEGAMILDIGGESTRPGAPSPAIEEELRRVLPVIEGLRDAGAILSIDTRRAVVMHAALAAGAFLVNDVSGLTHDPAAARIVAAHGCPVVMMHSRGTPQTMQSLTTYTDVALDTVNELETRIAAAIQTGIPRANIIIDPGIGFAKTAMQSVELLARLPILAILGCRLLLGVSRKSFIGRLANVPDATARLPGSITAAHRADVFTGPIHRVHDVVSARQALDIGAAVRASC